MDGDRADFIVELGEDKLQRAGKEKGEFINIYVDISMYITYIFKLYIYLLCICVSIYIYMCFL